MGNHVVKLAKLLGYPHFGPLWSAGLLGEVVHNKVPQCMVLRYLQMISPRPLSTVWC